MKKFVAGAVGGLLLLGALFMLVGLFAADLSLGSSSTLGAVALAVGLPGLLGAALLWAVLSVDEDSSIGSGRESRSDIARDDQIQMLVVAGGIGLFCVWTLWVIPGGNPYLLALGIVYFLVAWTVGSRLGEGDIGVGDATVFIFGCLFPLAIAAIATPRPHREHSFLAAGFAFLCTEGIWALYRCRTRRLSEVDFLRLLKKSVSYGMAAAAGLSILAAIIMGVGMALNPGDIGRGFEVLAWIVGGYFVGGFLAGVLFAFLRPLVRWPLGTMLMGAFLGTAVYGAMAPVVIVFESDATTSLGEHAMIAVVAGSVVGPLVALAKRDSLVGE